MQSTMRVLPLWAALCACGSKSSSMPAATEFPAAGEPARVLLEKAGAKPKSELRFSVYKGMHGAESMDLQLDVTAKGIGQAMDNSLALQSDIDVAIDDVHSDGAFVTKSVVQNPRMKLGGDLSKMAAGREAGLTTTIAGDVTTVTKDLQGRLLAIQRSNEAPLLKQMSDGMDSVLAGSTLVFPEAPVGVGATWRSLANVDMMGSKVPMVTDFELVALAGRKGRVEITMHGAVPSGATLMMPTGEGTVQRFVFEGSGKVGFDLDRPVTVDEKLEMKVDTDVLTMGQRARMTMTAKLALTSHACVSRQADCL